MCMLVIKLERERERERESKHESEGVAIYVYVQSKCISNNSTTPKTTPFILGEFQYNKVRAHITHTHNTHLPYILRALLQLFQLRHRVMPQRFVQWPVPKRDSRGSREFLPRHVLTPTWSRPFFDSGLGELLLSCIFLDI